MSAPVGSPGPAARVASPPADRGAERGMALIMAILVLLVLSVVVIMLFGSLNTDTKVAGHGVRLSQALNTAEAGVAEAVARIRQGDVPNNNNPRMVSQIFLTSAGFVPVLGADSVGLATAQPDTSQLAYSTPTRGPKVLTVKYKTNTARTLIYRYDPAVAPPVQTTTGIPIFEITSTGQVGDDYRKIVTEVFQRPIQTNVYGALAADQSIKFSGNSCVCGYNHSAATPVGTREPACAGHHLGTYDVVGGWSTQSITRQGSSYQDGVPDDYVEHQTGFYQGPWQAIGMTQSEFFGWVGAPYNAEPGDPQGIYYLDKNAVNQDNSGGFAYHGGDGEGLLYVDGNLTINGNFNFKGLIYVEGDLAINGTTWILGAIIVKGTAEIKIANGSCTILYSRDAIIQNISKHGGQFATLSWREGH